MTKAFLVLVLRVIFSLAAAGVVAANGGPRWAVAGAAVVTMFCADVRER